jgi:hypothetical protein
MLHAAAGDRLAGSDLHVAFIAALAAAVLLRTSSSWFCGSNLQQQAAAPAGYTKRCASCPPV